MDTKALRQKILDLAIHGKLVPQDPNDEPASVLLERIKAEKERLIKEGKIKRSRKSAKSSDTPHYKLVPQDPNDEPASVLLERIKAEKERLIKEGKIKRSRKSAKSSDTPHYENVPFEVPEGWVWTTINELCDVVRGGSPRPAGDEKYYNGAIPFLKVADLTKDDGIFLIRPIIPTCCRRGGCGQRLMNYVMLLEEDLHALQEMKNIIMEQFLF